MRVGDRSTLFTASVSPLATAVSEAAIIIVDGNLTSTVVGGDQGDSVPAGSMALTFTENVPSPSHVWLALNNDPEP